MDIQKAILIADDDADDRYLISRAFKDIMLPEKLSFVENGQQVLVYLETISKDDDLPGLIVLDLNMPLMDGIETLKQLKSKHRYKSIPVVIFSTSKNPQEENQVRELGAADFITKPSSYTEIKVAVKLLHGLCVPKPG
jgi:two-component system response regulator